MRAGAVLAFGGLCPCLLPTDVGAVIALVSVAYMALAVFGGWLLLTCGAPWRSCFPFLRPAFSDRKSVGLPLSGRWLGYGLRFVLFLGWAGAFGGPWLSNSSLQWEWLLRLHIVSPLLLLFFAASVA